MDNLVLLCSYHHHLIHKPGWHLKLRPDSTVEVTNPDGHVTTSDPPLLCRRKRMATWLPTPMTVAVRPSYLLEATGVRVAA